MTYLQQQTGEGLVEKFKAKAFLTEHAMRQASLHWWITSSHRQAQLIHEKLKKDLFALTQSTNETQLSLELQNTTTIRVFNIDTLSHYMGEVPVTIIFDHLEIPFDTWEWFFYHIKNFGTLTTFFIASKVKPQE